MTMDAIIERHLSADQMAEIAADEYRRMCREYFARIGHSTAIGNVAYPIVRQAIDEVLGGSAADLITAKALEVINGLSSYTVFHAPNAYDRAPSESWKLLQKAVAENETALRDRVAHHIHNLSKSDALEIIKSSKLTTQTGAA